MSRARPDPFARALDTVLERLRVHQLAYRPHHEDVDRWLAVCPICHGELSLREPYLGAPVTAVCSELCDEQRIVAALAAAPVDEPASDLAEAASEIAHRALELAEAACR